MEEKFEYKTRKYSLINQYFYPVSGAFGGVLMVAISNYYQRRPYHAGIQRHIFWGVVGSLIALSFERHYEKKWSERDAMVRHYIELHPEEFSEHKRKYKEIFDEWYPMR